MKIICENGFYKFYPQDAGDLLIWNGTKETLKPCRGFYTFEKLVDFPNFSLAGQFDFKNGLLWLKNYAGRPEDVMRENSLTYSIAAQMVLPTIAIISFANFDTGTVTVSSTLPQAYSYDGIRRIESFVCWWDKKFDIFKMGAIEYANI